MTAAISTVSITKLAVFREDLVRCYHIHGLDFWYYLSEFAYSASFNQIAPRHYSKRFIESLSRRCFLGVTVSVEAAG